MLKPINFRIFLTFIVILSIIATFQMSVFAAPESRSPMTTVLDGSAKYSGSASDIAFAPNGDMIVIGNSSSKKSSSFQVLMIDPANLSVTPKQTVTNASAYSIIRTSDDSYLVVGEKTDNSFYLSKLKADLTEITVPAIMNGRMGKLKGVCESTDKGFFLLGEKQTVMKVKKGTPDLYSCLCLYKVDKDFSSIKGKLFLNLEKDQTYALDTTSDNGCIVAGPINDSLGNIGTEKLLPATRAPEPKSEKRIWLGTFDQNCANRSIKNLSSVDCCSWGTGFLHNDLNVTAVSGMVLDEKNDQSNREQACLVKIKTGGTFETIKTGGSKADYGVAVEQEGGTYFLCRNRTDTTTKTTETWLDLIDSTNLTVIDQIKLGDFTTNKVRRHGNMIFVVGSQSGNFFVGSYDLTAKRSTKK